MRVEGDDGVEAPVQVCAQGGVDGNGDSFDLNDDDDYFDNRNYCG